MDDNEKNPPQEPKSDKKLQLDLSEALPQGSDDDDEIIELKDEVTPPPMAEEAEIDLDDQMNEDMQGDEAAAEKIINLDALIEETDDESVLLLGIAVQVVPLHLTGRKRLINAPHRPETYPRGIDVYAKKKGCRTCQ